MPRGGIKQHAMFHELYRKTGAGSKLAKDAIIFQYNSTICSLLHQRGIYDMRIERIKNHKEAKFFCRIIFIVTVFWEPIRTVALLTNLVESGPIINEIIGSCVVFVFFLIICLLVRCVFIPYTIVVYLDDEDDDDGPDNDPPETNPPSGGFFNACTTPCPAKPW